MKTILAITVRLYLLTLSIVCATSLTRAADPVLSPPNATAVVTKPASAVALGTNTTAPLTNLSTGPRILGFGELAGYELKLTEELLLNTNRPAWADAQIRAMIPEPIRKLDGQRVLVEGFMYPVEYEQDRLTEFMLVRDMPSCCFGFPPNPHEWVSAAVVKTAKIKAEVYRPVRVGGIFHVGPQRQAGYLSGIYRLEADKLEDAPH